MGCEGDSAKAPSNWSKHGVRFADAAVALEDALAITVEDDHPSERRFVNIGADAFGRLLVVCYTWRGPDTIRIISARRATQWERRYYEEHKG